MRITATLLLCKGISFFLVVTFCVVYEREKKGERAPGECEKKAYFFSHVARHVTETSAKKKKGEREKNCVIRHLRELKKRVA